MVKGWCTKHGDWNNWETIGVKDPFMCPDCLSESRKKRNKKKETKGILVATCGLCHEPLSKKSKGKKCGKCGAVFTNPEIMRAYITPPSSYEEGKQ